MGFKGNPIFIGGSMKYRITLLLTLISSHEKNYGGLESHWFDKG